MDAFRRILDTIKQQLGRLSPSDRLLIGSFAVILVLGLLLVGQFTGKSSMVPLLPGMAAADQPANQSLLTANGITAKIEGGQIVVPVDQKDRAMAVLSTNMKLPADTSAFFQNLVANQSWSNTRQQNEQLYNAALKAELDRIISSMPGIKSANVLFDVPEASGIGSSVRKPTASVAVFTQSGLRVDQKLVDAIAALVGGSKAGLSPDRVRVIDGTGQHRRTTSEDDILSSSYLDHATKVEHDTQIKLMEMLGHIPGVVVTVTAQVDVTRVTSTEKRFLPVGDGSVTAAKRINEDTAKQSEAGRGGEPGVRSNQPTDINRGGSRGSSNETEKTDKENENQFGSRVAETVDPRGMPTQVAVSVSIPRGYIAAILKGADGKGTADDKAVTAAFESTYKPDIKAAILPHVRAMTAAAGVTAAILDSQIVVSLIPVDSVLIPGAPGATQQASGLGGFAGGGMVLGMSMGQLIDKAVLGILGIGALGFMFTMIRKANKKQDLPTAEEIVGLPPALETKSDLIGEADESDTPLAGIELGEGEVRTAKLLEQVNELVKTNPEGAAKLIKRWVSVEE